MPHERPITWRPGYIALGAIMLVFSIKMDETEIISRQHWAWFHDHGPAWQWSLMFFITSMLVACGALLGGWIRVVSKLALSMALGLIAWALYNAAPHGIDMWVYGIATVFSFWLTIDEGMNRPADNANRG